MIIAVWIVALLGMALWSLVAWGTHAVLTIDPQWLGDLAPLTGQVPYAETLAHWVPGWQELVRTSLEAMQTVLAWVGAGAPAVVIAIWLFGTVLLVGIAIVLTIAIRLMRRKAASARLAY
jgi:hypothetical protein